MIWQFIYVLDGCIIKSSIVWTLLRLAKNLNHVYRNILWCLFAFNWITWQIAWPVAIFQCKPVAAAWGEPGDCTSGQTVILRVSYFVSAANIFTDVTTTLIPVFLLRHLQMPAKRKALLMGILSLGAVASVATTIRISYTWAYLKEHDRLCAFSIIFITSLNVYNRLTIHFIVEIGKIVLLTVLECDLGIIAGSMPMLRPLFRSLDSSYSNSGAVTPGRSTDINLVTIGGSSSRRTHQKLTNPGNSRLDRHEDLEEHSEDKESNGDDESTRRIIQVTREVEQDSVSAQDMPGSNFQVAISSKHKN